MAKRVILQRDNRIHVVELCAPPANVTDQLFFQEMADVITILQESRDCEGVIVRGCGRHFSSGANIEELKREFAGHKRGGEELRTRSLFTYHQLSKLPFPVVAAIKGCCLGSGLELALACHYRIATRTSLFSMPETGFGLMPGCGGTSRLPETVGLGKSIEIILTGRNYLAEDALKINLIDCIVEKNELMSVAGKIIHRCGELLL